MDWDLLNSGLKALAGTLFVTFGGQWVLAGFVSSESLRVAALCLGIGFFLGGGLRFEPSDPAQIAHLGGAVVALWLFWRLTRASQQADAS